MKELTPYELKKWISAGKDFMLIDIRENWERDQYNIGGTHLPLGELIHRINEIPGDKDVVLYCEKGIRSVIAIQRLETSGFHNLFNLSGGMAEWKKIEKR